MRDYIEERIFQSAAYIIENGATVLSTLTTWALEGGIVTADSMRSRGYGSGRRTSFAIYRFAGRDMVLAAVMLLCVAAVLICAGAGGAEAAFIPTLSLAHLNEPATAAMSAAYFIFLAIPTVLNITEEIIWHILRSRI